MVEKYKNRIVIDPEVMTGKPVIKGTRMTVELILRQLAEGEEIEDILEKYPHIEKEDVFAAIAYAGDLVEEEGVYPLKKEHAGN